jgi:outer membrane protein OmpA-like peptidoglycan-associated protein
VITYLFVVDVSTCIILFIEIQSERVCISPTDFFDYIALAFGIDKEFSAKGHFIMTIRFGGDSVEFSDVDREQLDIMRDYLLTYPESVSRVTGHTDSSGSAVSHYRLSLYRAETVKSYFLGKGRGARS